MGKVHGSCSGWESQVSDTKGKALYSLSETGGDAGSRLKPWRLQTPNESREEEIDGIV